VHAVQRDQVKLSFNPSIEMSRRLYKVEWKPSDATRVAPARIGRDLWKACSTAPPWR